MCVRDINWIHTKAYPGWRNPRHHAGTTLDPWSVWAVAAGRVNEGGGGSAGWLCGLPGPGGLCLDRPTVTPRLPVLGEGRGAPPPRWVSVPSERNAAVVPWVCHTRLAGVADSEEEEPMIVTNWESDARALGEASAASACRWLDGGRLRLAGGSRPYAGQCIRCMSPVPVVAEDGASLRTILPAGETVRVVGPAGRGGVLVKRATESAAVRVGTAPLAAAFRPARIGTLAEQTNCYFARRPVEVILNRSSNRLPHDALYIALGLGPNVTVVANRSGLVQACARWQLAAAAPAPAVPPVWVDVVRALLHKEGDRESDPQRNHIGRKEDSINKGQTARRDCDVLPL